MSDRTKLTLASLAAMILPYRIDFLVTVLVLTAAMCMAIEMARKAWAPDRIVAVFHYRLS